MGREDLLPRMKLQVPAGDSTDGSLLRPRAGPSPGQETSSHSNFDLGLDLKEERDRDSSMSPSDGRGDTAGSDEYTSSLEKKKMKRFRLTHNQTRFLMSEFTRQAHPDAAHRERLSREIPGLTPDKSKSGSRTAKLKRLTTNDRERMLKSRALPDDFDTSKVLRTPFEGKPGQTSLTSPHDFNSPNTTYSGFRGIRHDGFRPSDDEYLVSPLSSGPYMSSAGQGREGFSSSSVMFGRPGATGSLDQQRPIRSDYNITRSSSISDTSPQPNTFHAGYPIPGRLGPSSGPGLPYGRSPIDYAVVRPASGMVPGYDQSQSFDNSVSPTDTQGNQIQYDMSNLGTQPPNYAPRMPVSAQSSALGLNTQLPNGRPLSSLQSLPQDYRPFSYGATSSPLGSLNYAPASGASNLNLPATYAPSDQGITADQMQQGVHSIDTVRNKFTNPSFNYAGYIQQ
ncbi:hypothetical protein N7468_006432 [Penicillium chermesinum]|uniref:Homeobox transcription factor n=1 Tax=Penicillium chermesinum TaxID=63820 RepID=A0A9W9NS78_9EURO|nr:uncharacterized protein N7468_006432 [Penicillium chermesinum]KAJ5225207.1 hypothetical protein N7468_006432 [Penicillium chermesinum]